MINEEGFRYLVSDEITHKGTDKMPLSPGPHNHIAINVRSQLQKEIKKCPAGCEIERPD